MLKLECKGLAQEGCDCWEFVETCSAALWACPLKAHGVLMYPLQLLTGKVPMAAMLATTAQPATEGREPPLTVSTPTMSRTLAVPSGSKCWQVSSKQSLPTPWIPPVEEEGASAGHPCKRLGPLKEDWWEAFSKESSLVSAARWTYQESHPTDFTHKESHDLSSMFCKMASSAHLLDSSIFEVQDTWCGWTDLKAANQVAKHSPKCILFFRLISPQKSPQNNGSPGYPFPWCPHLHGSLAFCSWCGKEG